MKDTGHVVIAALDSRLIGRCRTSTVVSESANPWGPSVSYAEDFWMVFSADGTMVYQPGNATDPPLVVQAYWRTADDVLYAQQPGGPMAPIGRYHIEGNRMLLTYASDGSSEAWERM